MALYLSSDEEAALTEVLKDPRAKNASADIIDDLIYSIEPSTAARTGYAKYEKKEAPGLFTEQGFLVLATTPGVGTIKFSIPKGAKMLKLDGAYILNRGYPIYLKTESSAELLDYDGEGIEDVITASSMMLNQFHGTHNQKSHGGGRFDPKGGGRPLTEKEESDWLKDKSPRQKANYQRAKESHEQSKRRSIVAHEIRSGPNKGRIVPVSVENNKTFARKAAEVAFTTALIVGYVGLRLAAESSATSSRPSGGGGGYQRSRNYQSPYKKRDTPESHRAEERAKVNDYAKNLREQRRKEKAASGGSNRDFRSTGFRSETGQPTRRMLELNP